MATAAAFWTEPDGPKGQIGVIENHQQVLQLDPIKAHESTDSLAARVHIRLRLLFGAFVGSRLVAGFLGALFGSFFRGTLCCRTGCGALGCRSGCGALCASGRSSSTLFLLLLDHFDIGRRSSSGSSISRLL